MNREFMEYMGKRVKSFPDGNVLTRENLVANPTGIKWFSKWYTDDAMKNHIDEILKPYTERALSYDINMRYFSTLNGVAFNDAVSNIVTEFRMDHIDNLKDVNGIPGIYMMILGKYNSFYVGQSKNISQRVAGHWSTKMEIWRLVFGPVMESILSINVFRALDTTDIYYFPLYDDLTDWEKYDYLSDLLWWEEAVTESVMNKGFGRYMINRLMGGHTNVDYVFRGDEANRLNPVITDEDLLRRDKILQMYDELDKYRKL